MQRVSTVSADPRTVRAKRASPGTVVNPDVDPTIHPTGLRLAPIALTTSTGAGLGTESRTSQAVRLPLHYAPLIRRWRVHVRNGNDVTGVSTGSPVNLTGLWFGPGWDGTFFLAPTQIHGEVTIPSGGGEWVSPWINTPIGGGQRMMLSAGLTNSAGTNAINPGGCWRNTYGEGASTAGNTSGAGYVAARWAPLNWWVEVEVGADVPVIAAWGDSNTAGTGTSFPVNDSWLSQYAYAVGGIPMHVAYPGTAMFQWASDSERRWTRFANFRADAVIHFMGQNDLASTLPLAEMQTRYNATVELLKAKVSPNLYLATITPSGRKTPDQNTVRREYETWLRTLPGGARDLFEFGQTLSTDDTTIADSFDSGDQLHFNTAGHTALAAAITRPVVSLGGNRVRLVRVLTKSDRLDNLSIPGTEPGYYGIPSTAVGKAVGAPEAGVLTVLVLPLGNGLTAQTVYTGNMPGGAGVRQWSRTKTTVWSGWSGPAGNVPGRAHKLMLADSAGAAGHLVQLDHYANGSGESGGQTYGLDIHNFNGARQAMVIHQYSNAREAFRLDNTGTNAGIYINNTQNLNLNPGSSGADAPFLKLHPYNMGNFLDFAYLMGDLTFKNDSTRTWSFQSKTGPIAQMKNAAGSVVGEFDQQGRYSGGMQDTGWRNIVALLVNGWTATELQIKRVAGNVHFRMAGLDPAHATSDTFLPGLTGFTSARTAILVADGLGAPVALVTNDSGDLAISRSGLTAQMSPHYRTEFHYTTADAMPTASPGTPARD